MSPDTGWKGDARVGSRQLAHPSDKSLWVSCRLMQASAAPKVSRRPGLPDRRGATVLL